MAPKTHLRSTRIDYIAGLTIRPGVRVVTEKGATTCETYASICAADTGLEVATLGPYEGRLELPELLRLLATEIQLTSGPLHERFGKK